MKSPTFIAQKPLIPGFHKKDIPPKMDSSFTFSKRKVTTPSTSGENLLTDSDKEMYGDREPSGYKKLSLLGKGGAAVVWLGKHISTGEKVALKQFPKRGDTSSV